VVAGLSNHLGEHNYGCLVHGVTPQRFERSVFLGDSRVDGICAFLSGDADTRRGYLERLLTLKTPVVGIEDTNIGLDPDLAVVHQDDFGAAVRLTRRLLKGGSRNLFVLAPAMPWPSVTERLAGMESEVLRSGDDARLTVVTCGTGTIAEAHSVVPATLGARLPERSVLVGASDRLAIAATRLAGALYRADTPDVRVASFSASEASRDPDLFDLMALSDPYRIGVESGRTMVDRIESGYFVKAELVVPVKVVSGRLPRSDDARIC
jgi:LacI family transcriptional regulator